MSTETSPNWKPLPLEDKWINQLQPGMLVVHRADLMFGEQRPEQRCILVEKVPGKQTLWKVKEEGSQEETLACFDIFRTRQEVFVPID